MFEDRDHDYILEQLLSKVTVNVSTEEGSLVYAALSPLAYELEKLYIEFDTMLSQTFAQTADYDYLEMRAAERGLTPITATYCQSLGVFDVEIPEGSRFSISGLFFVSGDSYDVESGYGYVMTCETAGTTANGVTGSMELEEINEEDFDVSTVTSAELVSILIPARDKETRGLFLQRYLDSFDTQAFGGNVTDYMNKINAINGVGGTHIYPVWDGAGTVKAVIIGTDYNPASEALVSLVKSTIDPDDGLGGGLAPIGATVTVASAAGTEVTVKATITPTEDEITDELKNLITAAVDAYLLELRKSWQSEYMTNKDGLTVRIAEVESRILNVDGVTDVADVTINGKTGNLILPDDAVPLLKEVVI